MSKSLSDIFSSQFNEMALSRGAAYFENGAVTQVTGDATRVEAEVVGASRYRVALRFDAEDAILTVSCTCTYFTNRFVACKHQWAALLQADKDQLLGAALEASNPTLVESDELEEEGSEPEPPTRRHKRNRSASYGGKPYVPASSWRIPMGQLRDTAQRLDAAAGTRLLYVLDLQPSSEPGRLVLQIAESQRGRNGEWGRARPRRVTYEDMQQLADPADREIFSLLTGSSADAVPFDAETPQAPMRYRLKPEAELALVSRMCATGRCHTKSTFRQETGEALRWEDGDPWRIRLSVTDSTKGSALILVADLVQDLRRLDLGDPDLLVGSTVLVSGGVAAPLHAPGMDGLIDTFRKLGSIEVPKTDEREFIDSLMTLPAGLQIDLPERLELSREHPLPRPQLHLATPKGKRSTTRLEAALEFYYAGHRVKRTDPRSAIFDDARRCILSRNLEAERDAASRLVETGFTARKPSPGGPEYTIAERDLIPAVRTLMGLGWKVTAEGHPFRTPGAFRPSVRSGVDWFELAGSMAFGDEDAPLPLLLRAATTRRQTIQLGDGSIGILPEEWLERFAFLAGLGSRQDDHLRFNQSQTALLDALLRHFPPADTDAVFDAARKRMQDFEGVKAGAAAASFTGVLRHYQEDGLGWLEFLREFGFGGCLADDMGLGKTVQVLALLDAVRARADKPLLPSLVVAPRSVLWNWVREAERFTPQLKVMVHAGGDRAGNTKAFKKHHLVITTYGTLKRDITFLKDQPFDTVVLDEAQAVKNAATVGSKAVRLLQAEHRLALSGTPVENHLGELWSLFEFLNPGMLGTANGFRKLVGTDDDADGNPGRELVARAVAPFILRRTKTQVTPELPEKTEQTLFCEMKPTQRKQYDELRNHYRRSIRDQVESAGLGRSKMHILEALLRLRQAACHPRLIDADAEDKASIKLDVLVPKLEEIIEEGNKALVFSQFTKFLSLLRGRLDTAGMTYEYLDGRTRDREAKVDRFQEDPDCSLFLISLKAGGVGLNLTAAGYVFLLDPWWNPAVEAQAIDRAHRIGQTRPVFAYRLIAKDTVEERILDLQEQKRDLAEAVVAKDGTLLKSLRPEDLELLLS